MAAPEASQKPIKFIIISIISPYLKARSASAMLQYRRAPDQGSGSTDAEIIISATRYNQQRRRIFEAVFELTAEIWNPNIIGLLTSCRRIYH